MKNASAAADTGVGILNGVLGGSTGLAGIVPMIWSGLRGWTRDEQRAVFQPTGLATFLMSILIFGSAGFVTPDTIRLFEIGLPVLIAGTLLGWACYGKLDEASFRQIVLLTGGFGRHASRHGLVKAARGSEYEAATTLPPKAAVCSPLSLRGALGHSRPSTLARARERGSFELR